MSDASSDLAGGRAAPPVERDIEQAITALKKGAYLLKYGRRGKPKFCPFRLSNDESVLIWFSGKEEKHLRLSQVSRIVPGQRTAIFQRYPRPEKECQSFSLISHDRSLDIICKDKDEAEVWFAGLKTLISHSHQRKWRTESRSDIISSGATSPRTYTRRSSPLSSPFSSNDSVHKVFAIHHLLNMNDLLLYSIIFPLCSCLISCSKSCQHLSVVLSALPVVL
jgi:hypothetical protein